MTPAPSSPLVTAQSPAAGPSSRPSKKRARTNESPLPTPKRRKVDKRRKRSGKGKFSSGTKGKLPASFDNFPEDSCLFRDSQDSFVEHDEEESIKVKVEPSSPSSTPKTEERLVGNDLYLARRAKKKMSITYFTIQYTIGTLYLALLYTNQKILPSDFNR